MPGLDPPTVVIWSDKIYQKLLVVYPPAYRHEYGPLMAQHFRDLCRDAYRHAAARGIVETWLHVLIDLGLTASIEHAATLRRWMVNKFYAGSLKKGLQPGWPALLLALVVIVAGMWAKTTVMRSGGSVASGALALVASNLAAAAVLDFAGRAKGWVLAGSVIVTGSMLLPLAWVTNPAQWLETNPLTSWTIIMLGVNPLNLGRRGLCGAALGLTVINILFLSAVNLLAALLRG